MRSWPSSVLSSPRVLVRSSLFLDHSWPALILLLDCDIVSVIMLDRSFVCWEGRRNFPSGYGWRLGFVKVVRVRAEFHGPNCHIRPQGKKSIGIGIETHHFREGLSSRFCLLGRRFVVVIRVTAARSVSCSGRWSLQRPVRKIEGVVVTWKRR